MDQTRTHHSSFLASFVLVVAAWAPSGCAHQPPQPSLLPTVQAGARVPLVLVPCLSGAPWQLSAFPRWQEHTLVTGQLPDARTLEQYADQVALWTAGLSEYVLVGDSFGALVALALAERQPRGLRAVVISGGFARAHVPKLTRTRLAVGRLLGQAGYPLTVRFHVDTLRSRFDPPGTDAELRQIFLEHSDAATLLRRAEVALTADLRAALLRVNVPVLILTPEDDRLIGPQAVKELRDGLPDATEVVMKGTGHLLRFTHADEYAGQVERFLAARLASQLEAQRP
jgi:pimeloyl-ACP methyl ester carboxylesterase